MRILLVEDDELLADGLARALRQSGNTVDIAADGPRADSLLAAGGYDLTILDLGLPGLDGSQVLTRLRGRRQKTPVLVMSARMAIEERVRLLDLGADDYLVKPVALAELEARVRALIRRQQGVETNFLTLGLLRLEMVEFSQVFDSTSSSQAVVRVRASLIAQDRRGGNVLLGQKLLAVQTPATTADAAGGARAMATSVNRLAIDLSNWLQNYGR